MEMRWKTLPHGLLAADLWIALPHRLLQTVKRQLASVRRAHADLRRSAFPALGARAVIARSSRVPK